jgi:hypothetical protein
MIFIIIPLLVTSQSIQRIQKKQWEIFEYNLSDYQEGKDILIQLSKEKFTEPALLVGRSISPPVNKKSEEYWKIDGHYSDIQGFASKLNHLVIRVPYEIANITPKFYLGVYKSSEKDLAYSINSSYFESNKCTKECGNGGVCQKGFCSCKGLIYIGNDCNLLADTLTVDKATNFELDPKEWLIYRVATSDDDKNLKLSLSTSKSPGIRVFHDSSDVSYYLPSMLGNYEEFYLSGKNQEISQDLKKPSKSYWLWSFYCDSANPCKGQIKIYEKVSYSANFLWIIIASVISLGVFCICTPIILKLVFALKRRRLKKIADLETELKKKAFLSKYPLEKFSSSSSESCSICLEELKQGDSVHRLSCDHRFHPTCILEWYMTKPFCPLCKRDIMEVVNVENLS